MAVNDNVKALSDKLYDTMKGDSTTGIVKVDGDPYYENLPENLTREAVDSVDVYNTEFAAAGVKAFGRHFSNLASENENLSVFQGEINMSGKNTLSVQTDKVKTYPNPSGGDPIEKMGATRATINLHAAKSQSGQLHKAKDEVSELFKACRDTKD